jgi:hypothetical protein
MDYDKLSDRELDALVAEKVMGWDKCPCGNPECDMWHTADRSDLSAKLPHYSADIAAAWEVVEKLKESGRVVVVKADGLRGAGAAGYTVLIDGLPRVDAHSAARAVCVAALKAAESQE